MIEGRAVKNEGHMEINTIQTAADYLAALQEIDEVMLAEVGTPAGDRLEMLATLVEDYEAISAKKEKPDG